MTKVVEKNIEVTKIEPGIGNIIMDIVLLKPCKAKLEVTKVSDNRIVTRFVFEDRAFSIEYRPWDVAAMAVQASSLESSYVRLAAIYLVPIKSVLTAIYELDPEFITDFDVIIRSLCNCTAK